jgi:hypothetical protein
MDGLAAYLDRLMELDVAVRTYLSCLWAVEQGAEDDDGSIERWRSELERLTADEDDPAA